MATDEELVEKLKEFLRSSDLSTTTTGTVRRHLESEFNTDLSHKKAFIREQVDLCLSAQMKNENEGNENDENREDDNGGIKEEEEEDEEDEEEEEEMEGSSKKRRLSKCNNNEKKKGGGFTKLCSLSEELQNFVGETNLARTEVVKRLWAYIKENNLQDPKNKRKILCNEALKKLFNVNSIDMFQMNKALTKHIWPLEDDHASEGSSKLVKREKKIDDHASEGSSKSKEKSQKKEKEKQNDGKKQKIGQTGQTGLLAPIKISEELKNFLETEETSLARSDAVKRMWAYIKQNNLQDPADRRNIICDDKLKELFKVDSFLGFSVAKFLTPHFIKD